MTAPIRVMIVDDSLIVRRLVEDSLREVPGIEVVGTAGNGRVALEKIGALRPDVVTLDVEMPELDGISTLRRLRQQHPNVHVIMFSSLTSTAAKVTLEALAAGASDYVAKPTGNGNMTATRERIRDELVPKVRALCARKPLAPAAQPTVPAPRRLAAGRVRAVAIGVSTGGPAALDVLLAALPRLGVPIFVVQHMPAEFTQALVTQLSSVARMPVTLARHGEAVVPDRIWFAPGGRHLHVAKSGEHPQLALGDGAPECSCRPAADVLFRTVASVYGMHTLGVVLTGMGEDGMRGAEAIRAAGGTVYVQDASSSVVWGMPGAVARAGLADRIVPLSELAPAITSAITMQPPPVAKAGLRERA